jgi:small-conductance mechanosensitive channel
MTDQWSLEKLTPWLIDASVHSAQAAIRIFLIVLVGWISAHLIRMALTKLEAMLIRAGEGKERVRGTTRKRVATLTGMVRTIVFSLIWGVVLVMSLEQIGLNIAPILAGAGIFGLAVGFGAQNLVRDLISGFFMILENQVRVGDVAVVNGTGGMVESISYRTIALRDSAGTVHVFPNGTITTLANMTMDWSAYVLNIQVSYREDSDRVVTVMREVEEELRADPEFNGKILEPMEVFGVDEFKESGLVIQARIKTIPIEQWNVGREYRRRLKKAFDAHGIEIPLAGRPVIMAHAEPPKKAAG